MQMNLNPTHDPARKSWVESANEAGCDFPIQNLPFGVFSVKGERRVGVAIGNQVVDLQSLLETGLIDGPAEQAARATSSGRLNELMGMDRQFVSALRAGLSDLLRADSADLDRVKLVAERFLRPLSDVQMELPCDIGDYTDFLTSRHHTERHGRFKGLAEPLPPAFMSLPVAYHGRASSIRVSGTPVVRPNGQFPDANGKVTFGPATMLDFELEFAAFIAGGNPLSKPIPIDAAHDHIFGYVLLNDWSAKSIQWWEQILGPFLGKSFMTSISPWVITSEALLPFRMPAPRRPEGDPQLLPYLYSEHDQAQGGLNVQLEVWITTAKSRAAGRSPRLITQTHLQNLYWTFGQMVTHHASNGCNLRPGDLIASGTISGESDTSRACLTELTNAGKDPLLVAEGEYRTALEDGDEIIFKARAAVEGAVPIGFGECRGVVQPAVEWPA